MQKHKTYHTIPYITVFLMAAVLLGCSVGRNYKQPSLALPEKYNAAVSADSSLATRSWKVFFQDTTLAALIERSIAHNFNLQLAIKRIEVSRSYSRQARAAWLPAWNAQVAASTVNPSENSLNGISLSNFLHVKHIEDYTLSTGISWELDVWGKIRRQKQAALADYLQTYEAGRAVQTSLVAQVADSYYNLLMMDEQLAIARRNVSLSDSLLNIIRLQKDAGEVTELAVQQAQAQQQTAALLVPQLEQAITLQENAIHLLAGELPGEVARQLALSDIVIGENLATGVPADLLRFRPDVRASEQALIAANARVGVAQGNMYPALSLTASGGLNAYKSSSWFTVPASLFGTAAGNLVQPIFQRRALRTQFEVAKIHREEQVIAFRQSVTTAVHEVTNALIKIDKLATQQQVATARAQTLDQAVTNAQLLFRSGMANYLEVITAQSRALQASLEKSAITRQQLSARVELYASLGGGWK
ncbi:efflux transporter outer membrane subunit [Fulvivirgaceae bacterium PWU4]|uniref:Efflux transporter outer membrane subunit n=1 Tax=Chryseosolibacter histidini TaxID=2782349 RepID=A0AAP2DLU3_9BACT|nr:efflux transporter outer membrane subunit [Chryseosolibacter histidini]MBT1697648.1 efflux transporter outer membrane subunit [Chryseosolibacter histidini]